MSQYVQRATGMATKAMEVAKTRVLPPAVEYYNATMAKNAQYVVKDPEAVDKLGRQLVFSNLAKCVQPARAPPPHDPRARAITLGRTPARAGNREPRARGDDARHPVWTRSCLTAATPPPVSFQPRSGFRPWSRAHRVRLRWFSRSGRTAWSFP